MNQPRPLHRHRRHRTRRLLVPAALAGSILGLGALAAPPPVSAQSVGDGDCVLGLLCDGLDVVVDLGVSIAVAAPSSDTASDIVDVDVDLGLDVRSGDRSVVGANAPVDVGVSTSDGVHVRIDSTPTATASILPGVTDQANTDLIGGDASGIDITAGLDLTPQRARDALGAPGELVRADLRDLQCGLRLVVVDASGLRCAGSALAGVSTGIVGADAAISICNVSVVLFDDATGATCAAGGNDDDTGALPGPGGSGADEDTGVPPGTASGIRAPSQASSGDAELALTGTPISSLLAIAGSMIAAGTALELVRRRDAIGR